LLPPMHEGRETQRRMRGFTQEDIAQLHASTRPRLRGLRLRAWIRTSGTRRRASATRCRGERPRCRVRR
jgi:hypothetical protein